MGPELRKLQSIARAWGGDIVKVNETAWNQKGSIFDSFFRAPFTNLLIGIAWPTRRILYCGEVRWYDVIHEMGHIFATNDKPYLADEVSFLGWEYALMRHIGASARSWYKGNEDYGLEIEHSYYRFGDLPASKRRSYLKTLVKEGQKAGIIDAAGRPLSILSPESLGTTRE